MKDYIAGLLVMQIAYLRLTYCVYFHASVYLLIAMTSIVKWFWFLCIVGGIYLRKKLLIYFLSVYFVYYMYIFVFRDCFLHYVTHKVRSAIGKTKAICCTDHVLVAFSGGAASSALLNFIHEV